MQSIEQSVFNSSKNVFNISKKLGVSSFAFLYRAYSIGQISLIKYRELRKHADADFQAFILKEREKAIKAKEQKKGGPDYFMLLVNKNSHLFTRVVMDAFRGGHIQPTHASNLLNTQVNNFPKLEAFLYK